VAVTNITLLLLAMVLAQPAWAGRTRTPEPIKLGMIAASPDGSSDPFAAIEAARALGADPLLHYWSWADLKGRGPEALMPALTKGGRVVVNLSVVSTTVLGKYPAPWTHFTQSGFAEALAVDVGAFAAKWKPAFLCVGNEAGTYLSKHPAEVDAYERVVRQVAGAVKAASPDTQVCVTLSFRDSTKDDHALAKRLAASAMPVWTVYGYHDPGYRFTDPADGIAWLDRVEAESPKPYAISETGWNSAEVLGSSEAAQADFVKRLRAHPSSAQFTQVFYLRDGKDCTARARAFLTPEQLALPADKLEPYLAPFKAMLCNFGVLRSDGSEKPAAGGLR
jgi:hypothetical protein